VLGMITKNVFCGVIAFILYSIFTYIYLLVDNIIMFLGPFWKALYTIGIVLLIYPCPFSLIIFFFGLKKLVSGKNEEDS